MFGCLPFVKPCGKQVDQIDRRHAKLEQIPDEVLRSFRTLEECRLDANQIKELPKNFFRLERIRYLTLSDNDLTEIPAGLGKFSHLVELDISRNDISTIPNSIRFCDSLQTVDISNNPLQSLPAGFSQLSKLRVLCMNDISLSELPSDFGNLRLLEKCELRDNRLTTLPQSFSQLVRLEFLDLGANDFRDLPIVLGNLPSLTELWMDDNELQSVPAELGNIQCLQQLDLSENNISSLPEEISGLVSLCDLNLSVNNLNCLPNSFGELKKLTVLKLNQNQLLTLTASIGGCTSLQELYLTENFLSALPPTIGDLDSMFLLNVDQNQLSELPTEIRKCTSLNILSVRENLLRRLPNEIGQCSRLRVLDVSGNRLERLPLTLAQCPLTALWLSQNQSQPVITLQRDVDEITHEEFLTCYLLPQDQLTSQVELDPTVSPSGLASLTGPVHTNSGHMIQHRLDEHDAIPADPNYAYEPAQSISLEPDSAGTRWTEGANPLSTTSVTSSTTSSTRSPSAPISPTGPPTSSVSPRPSLSIHSGELDSNVPGSSRVHFSAAVARQQEEQSKSKTASKGFPKTRHPRFSRKIGDGLSGNRDDRPPSELSYAVDNRRGSTNSPTHLDVRTQSPPTTVGTSTGEQHLNDHSALHLATSESWRGSNGSTAGLTPTEDVSRLNYYWGEEEENQRNMPSEKVNVNSLDQFGDHSDITKTTPYVKPRKKGLQTLPGVPQVNSQMSRYTTDPAGSRSTVHPAQDMSNPHDDDNDEVISAKLDPEADAEEDVYSSGGEEICVISRRVGFTEDVEDNEEKSNQKLIRRDTPHYNKRARIQSKTADGVDSEEAVLKILEKYRASVSPSAASSDAQVLQPDSHLKLVRASLHNSSSDPSRSQLFTSTPVTDIGGTSPRAQHEVVVHIHRQPGSGLGLSIAGGVGSIPYLGSDQGIFVSRLNPNGLAFSSGLRLNDKLIEVNGISLVKVEHHVAVSALRANTDHFRIVAIRDADPVDGMPSSNVIFSNPPPPMPSNTNLPTAASFPSPLPNSLRKPFNSSQNTLVRCTINREPSGLGFSIAGGRGTLPSSLEHETITISKITENGAASKCGQLQVGDQLLKINGIDVRDARHDQVIALLTGSGPRIDLEVLRSSIDTNKVAATSNPPNGYRMPISTTVSKPGSANTPYSVGFPSPRTKESWLGANHASLDTGGGVLDSNNLVGGQPVRLRIEQGYPVDQVTIRLNGGPLGLAIYGGSDINCLPFGGDEPGIFISKISTDGAAQNTGLRVGDRILRVNDIDLRHATHDEAVRALIQTTKELKLEVRRDPTPSGLRRITISRRVGERFGFRIAGGVPPTKGDAPLSNPLSRLSNDGSIIVTWISPDGAVGRDGRLKPGDRLLEVNGNWMMGNSLEEALEMFRRIGPSLSLVVCDGPLDLTLQSRCTVSTPNDAVPCPSNALGQSMSDLGGPMAGSAVDHADDLGDDLHANIVYSDAKRHFRTPVASSVYQVSS